jgi:hypothetical protein
MITAQTITPQTVKPNTARTRLIQSRPQRHLPPFHFEHFCCLHPFFLSCSARERRGWADSWGPMGWAMEGVDAVLLRSVCSLTGLGAPSWLGCCLALRSVLFVTWQLFLWTAASPEPRAKPEAKASRSGAGTDKLMHVQAPGRHRQARAMGRN